MDSGFSVPCCARSRSLIYCCFILSRSNTWLGTERMKQQEINERLLAQQGTENPLSIWKEMGAWMTEHVTVVRHNANLEKADAKLDRKSVV